MTSGQNATLDFTLEAAIVKLTEVVTTATGEQRRVELGNSVSTIDAASSRADVRRSTNMGDSARRSGAWRSGAAGRTMTGTGARIRIRGVNSLLAAPTIRSTSSTACA